MEEGRGSDTSSELHHQAVTILAAGLPGRIKDAYSFYGDITAGLRVVAEKLSAGQPAMLARTVQINDEGEADAQEVPDESILPSFSVSKKPKLG